MKSLKNGTVLVVITVLVAVIIRIFFLEIYKIPSSSMEPTLLPGDIILVSKMNYGARVLKPMKFLRQNKIEYIRLRGWITIKKGDVFVFNRPRYKKISDSGSSIYGSCVVKRCYGLPGDTVLIKNEGMKELKNEGMKELKNEGMKESKNGGIITGEIRDGKKREELTKKFQAGNVLFPHDSTLAWSLDNYGPLCVPAKGMSMELTFENVFRYRDVLAYENTEINVSDTAGKTDSMDSSCHVFRHDYYFMLGDSFYHSNDSRYWGFVPDDNIIGKAVLVLVSVDPNENGLRKIRLDRFCRSIH